MKYYVRTTGERDLSQYDFLNPIYLIDKEHKPVRSFIDQMKLISNDNCLFMEDDIIFCEDFINEVQKAIKQFPNMIINFFYRPMAYIQAGEVKGKNYIYNQCVYYPKGIAAKIAEELEKLMEGDIEQYKKIYDQYQGKALDNLGLNFINYRPCLVQHIGQKSILGNSGYGNFQTPFFKDDIKGLDYKNASQMIKRHDDFLDNMGIPRIKARIIKK